MEIFSPEKIIFTGSVESATFPGAMGSFTVLYNHAPLISVLDRGIMRWTHDSQEQTLSVSGGFVEVENNNVTVCVEII